MLKTIWNYVVLLLALLFGVQITAMSFVGLSGFEDISGQMYGPDKPLMNSYLLEVISTPMAGIFVLAIMLALIAKEFIVRPMQRRLMLNVAFLLLLVALSAATTYALYSPALDAPVA